MSKQLNDKLKIIIEGKIPRNNHDSEDYDDKMGKRCKAKEYVMYIDSNSEVLHVMSKSDKVSIPIIDLDVSIFKNNFKEVIQDKNGKLTSGVLWFLKGDNTSTIWEWFNWYFIKKG